MSKLTIIAAGAPATQRLGALWALDLSAAAKQRATDEQLEAPAWALLSLRESFHLAEDDEQDGQHRQGRAEIERQLGWTESDLDAIGALAAKASLPQRTALRLEVLASGVPGRPGYRIQARWTAASGESLLVPPHVEGLLLRRRPTAPPETLTASQARVLALLDEIASDLGQSHAIDRKVAAKLQAITGDGVDLRGGLASVPVREVEAIRPTLRPDGGGWRLGADVPGLAPNVREAPKPIRAIDAGGGFSLATRAGVATTSLLAPPATAAMRRTAELSRAPLSTAQVAQLVSRPEALLGTGFDLSEFSDRVVGLGPPVAHTSMVIRETEPEAWWSEFLVLRLQPHEAEGGTQIDGGDGEGSGEGPPMAGASDTDSPPAELRLDAAAAAGIAASIAAADARNEAWIAIDDRLVRIDQGLRDAVVAAISLEVERGVDGRLPKPARQVLRLHDNVEAVTYDRKLALATAPPPTRERPPSLLPTFALKPHQEEGVAWLRHALDSRAPGVLLADDMGLGKTLQVLAFLDHVRAADPASSALVVAPAGLLENWRQEAARYFGNRFQPMLVAPDQRDFVGDFAYVKARLISHPLVLISYETMVRQQSLLARIPWRVVIADEAHRAKNPATQTWNALAGMRADFRIAMTGTPVENGLQEL